MKTRFGCKCFILINSTRLTFWVFFVGYASNSHTYCILNKSTGCIEEMVNVECDENNSFHAEQFVSSVVGDEAPSQATSTMGIGHILPQETPLVHVEEEGVRAPLVDRP